MTESRILWLALGVFVGYVIWGESRKHHNAIIGTDGGNYSQPDSEMSDESSGFAPSTSSCAGGCQ